MSEHSVYSATVTQMNKLQDANARLRAGLREVRSILATGRTVGHDWQVSALIAENRIIAILEDEHEDPNHSGLPGAGGDTSMG